ncbi:unnamed protein product, partial [Lymnaea stagnalis]
ISAFLKTVQEKDDKDVNAMLLGNNTVRDEMSEDIEIQLVEKLKIKFSVHMVESTLRDSEAVLLTYVRCFDKGYFPEEMLLCNHWKPPLPQEIYI